MKKEEIKNIFRDSKFSKMDVHFAGFIYDIAEKKSQELALAAALVSYHTRLGHICLDLAAVAGKAAFQADESASILHCPDLGNWRAALLDSGVVADPGRFSPLVLDDKNRLYLYRYWDYEAKLIQFVQSRVKRDSDILSSTSASDLNMLFPGTIAEETDWQKIAAMVSMVQKFTVISGGPGTGKTTTVAKILALLIRQSQADLKIALAAPTGKAAARLQEAIQLAKKKLNGTDTIRDAIPENASTIHRLLGPIPGTPYFRFNENNTLHADVIVIDEASMVDLPLMAKLMQALPAHTRLILLGDKNQLASVEAGAVFGDICDAGTTHGFTQNFAGWLERESGIHDADVLVEESSKPIQNCMVQLRKSYRFPENSGIYAISHAINEGQSGAALELLKRGSLKDFQLHPLPKTEDLAPVLWRRIAGHFQGFKAIQHPEEAFHHLNKFRILCALREGPFGVKAINMLIERMLREQRIISGEDAWYAGKPVMITKNDYNLNLYNGDVGIVLKDLEAENDLRVFFPGLDGQVRKFHPLRLPAHETVYALTIHKSQGSEFDDVLVILPDRDYPVLTRELVYTAITRAKKRVEVWASEAVFKAAVSRKIIRSSGLRDALWGNN